MSRNARLFAAKRKAGYKQIMNIGQKAAPVPRAEIFGTISGCPGAALMRSAA